MQNIDDVNQIAFYIVVYRVVEFGFVLTLRLWKQGHTHTDILFR